MNHKDTMDLPRNGIFIISAEYRAAGFRVSVIPDELFAASNQAFVSPLDTA